MLTEYNYYSMKILLIIAMILTSFWIVTNSQQEQQTSISQISKNEQHEGSYFYVQKNDKLTSQLELCPRIESEQRKYSLTLLNRLSWWRWLYYKH